MKAIIYTRISTDDERQNIKQQREHCKKYAEREGYEVIHMIGDKCSGRVPIKERSGGKRVFKFLSENPKVHLIIQDLDRLSRDFYDGIEIEKFLLKYNINVKSISESVDLKSPMGKFTFRMKLAMNNLYVENLHQKIKIGVARAKAEGKYKGRKKGTKNRKIFKRKKKTNMPPA